MELLRRFPDPALAKLIGDTADARTVYRALLHLAAQKDGVDTDLLREARAFLREHRACLSTLSALSGSGIAPDDDDAPWIAGEDAKQ
jgi:hypothetical protein